MIELFVKLFERLGILAIIFIFSLRLSAVKRLLLGKATAWEKVILALVFGAIGIAGTYMGIPIQNAIANSRVIGVTLGGILGGPLVGLFAGIIAGGHRFLIDIGGFTAVACGLATVTEGFLGSLLYHRLKRRPFDAVVALACGVLVEILQMAIILLVAKPFEAALGLVQVIALPMIVANAVGLAVFVELVDSVYREQERVGAYQAQTALRIALKTLPILRSGLNHHSAAKTAQIILEMTDLDAVALTDKVNILAHQGIGEDHHLSGHPILTAATKSALAEDSISVPMTKTEIGCSHDHCQLSSSIIVPLRKWDRAIGALKLYRIKGTAISPLDMELADGLAHLFSQQLELSEVENQRKLAKEAEIRALQAQINPHFLFNAINTIISYTRTKPQMATDLLVKLAEFLRKNTNPGLDQVPLATELEHCQAYIAIETARFEDRVKVNYEIDEELLDYKLPPLILQPLVENALKHGILPREEGGEVIVGAYKDAGFMKIFVQDNGIGMSQAQVNSIFSRNPQDKSHKGAGIALKNINARLVALYGAEHALTIESAPQRGTMVSFSIPLA
ncbi:MAG: sensor histidine kinase [Deltaproteobacteria bacterium]|nr:sensor histidine kinase [Deltaproteobacteria bacterium]